MFLGYLSTLQVSTPAHHFQLKVLTQNESPMEEKGACSQRNGNQSSLSPRQCSFSHVLDFPLLSGHANDSGMQLCDAVPHSPPSAAQQPWADIPTPAVCDSAPWLRPTVSRTLLRAGLQLVTLPTVLSRLL